MKLNINCVKSLDKEKLIKVCPNGINFIGISKLNDDMLQKN